MYFYALKEMLKEIRLMYDVVTSKKQLLKNINDQKLKQCQCGNYWIVFLGMDLILHDSFDVIEQIKKIEKKALDIKKEISIIAITFNPS